MSTLGITSRKAKPYQPSVGTHTRDGLIPHLELLWDGGVLHAPVKVNPPRRGEQLPRPQIDRAGKVLFALPAGGEIAAAIPGFGASA
jgi:hypothetical protein